MNIVIVNDKQYTSSFCCTSAEQLFNPHNNFLWQDCILLEFRVSSFVIQTRGRTYIVRLNSDLLSKLRQHILVKFHESCKRPQEYDCSKTSSTFYEFFTPQSDQLIIEIQPIILIDNPVMLNALFIILTRHSNTHIELYVNLAEITISSSTLQDTWHIELGQYGYIVFNLQNFGENHHQSSFANLFKNINNCISILTKIQIKQQASEIVWLKMQNQCMESRLSKLEALISETHDEKSLLTRVDRLEDLVLLKDDYQKHLEISNNDQQS